MDKDTFESRIRRVVNTFEPEPPAGHWDGIQSHLQSVRQEASFTANPLALSFSVLTVLLTGALFFYYGNLEPVESPVLNNYWTALQVAEEEDKPLLVLFTRDCDNCDAIEKALRVPQIADLTDEFVQVHLQLNDHSPIDSTLAANAFPEQEKSIRLTVGDSPCLIELKAEEPVLLGTRGEVWQLLQEDRIGEAAPPVLAVFDHEGRAVPFQYYDKVDDKKRFSQTLHTFLKGELNFYRQKLKKGKDLFIANCAACHNRNMKDDMTGPALGGVRHRWRDYPTEDLYAYIRNSQEMTVAGHPKAVEIWNDWSPVVMTSFPNLSDQELLQLLDYVEWEYRNNRN